MTTAVKSGLIVLLALTTTGNDRETGNKSLCGVKKNEQMKTATISGQNSISSTEETDEYYLFPLSNAILNRL